MNQRAMATGFFAVAGIVVWLTFVGGIIFVLWHFASKFW
jgi:hypothetical protein